MSTRRYAAMPAALTLILFMFGCKNDDSGPTVPDVPTGSDPLAETVLQETEVLARSLVGMWPAWIQGQLGKDTTNPVWDPSCGCWKWVSTEEGFQEPAFSWGRSWTFQLTFLAADTPQMTPEGADRIRAVINYGYYDSDFTDENNNSIHSFYLDMLVEATGLGQAAVDISGSGSGTVGVEITRNGEYDYRYEALEFDLALTAPLGGCPAGSLALTAEAGSLTCAFDGTTTVAWTLAAPPATPQTGTFAVSCGD